MVRIQCLNVVALTLFGLLQWRVGSVVLLTTMEDVPNMETIHSATSPDVDHALEALIVLAANLANQSIRRVRVLLDASPRNASKHELNAKLRSAVWAAQEHFNAVPTASRLELERKLSCEGFGQQPTYADMLRYANAQWPSGSLVAVANADVMLRGADLLDQNSFAAVPLISDSSSFEAQRIKPLALVLSVSLPPSDSLISGSSRDACGIDQCNSVGKGYSWDVHVFETPLAPTVNFSLLEAVEPQPVYMNSMGAENRVGWMLHKAGYELRNPCIDIRAEHWHCAAKTHAKHILKERRIDRSIYENASMVEGLRLSGAGRRSGHGHGQAETSRVDALLVDEREVADIIERLRLVGYHIKGNTTSMRFFWVPRAEPGDGRGVRSIGRSSGLDMKANAKVNVTTLAAPTISSTFERSNEITYFEDNSLKETLFRQQNKEIAAANGVLSRRQIARQERNKRRGISGS